MWLPITLLLPVDCIPIAFLATAILLLSGAAFLSLLPSVRFRNFLQTAGLAGFFLLCTRTAAFW